MAASVVLNGAGHKKVTVSQEKAERIRQAARELRYRPNSLARALKSRQTGQVALVFQHFYGIGPENPYHIQIINGVVTTLFAKGYAMTLCPKMIVDGDVGSISDGRFDGVLWCRPDFTEASLESIVHASVPVVMMHVPPGMARGVPTFCCDNEGAMSQAVEHLNSLGHERLAFVIDPITANTVEGKVRTEAFLTAVRRARLPQPEVLTVAAEDPLLARYSQPDRPHTGLVCFSDELAGHMLAFFQRAGVQVPRQVSVVGFDSSPFCETTKPRLTSINQPVLRMAQEATGHLLKLIHEAEQGLPPSPMASCIYNCGLDVRESTGSPAAH